MTSSINMKGSFAVDIYDENNVRSFQQFDNLVLQSGLERLMGKSCVNTLFLGVGTQTPSFNEDYTITPTATLTDPIYAHQLQNVEGELSYVHVWTWELSGDSVVNGICEFSPGVIVNGQNISFSRAISKVDGDIVYFNKRATDRLFVTYKLIISLAGINAGVQSVMIGDEERTLTVASHQYLESSVHDLRSDMADKGFFVSYIATDDDSIQPMNIVETMTPLPVVQPIGLYTDGLYVVSQNISYVSPVEQSIGRVRVNTRVGALQYIIDPPIAFGEEGTLDFAIKLNFDVG